MQHEDIVWKNVFDLLSDGGLSFFGIKAKITAHAKTEYNVVEFQKKIDDRVYLLDDGTFLHLEFQSTSKSADIRRFMLSDAMLVNKENKSVRTIVIYTANIVEAENALVRGSLVYTVENFYMRNFDGDHTYAAIKAKVDRKEGLTKQDLMGLVLIPLMRNSVDLETRIEQSIDLSKMIDEEAQSQIIAMLYVFAEKFIADAERLLKVKEKISMMALGQMLVEDGRKEEKIEIAKNALQEGSPVDFVAKITGLTIEAIKKLKEELNK